MSPHPNQSKNPTDTRVCDESLWNEFHTRLNRDGAWRAERLFAPVNRLKPMPEPELAPSLSLIPCMMPEEKIKEQ